ncbi:hypothetical protein Har1130_02720 [Haloarcula sp. CBA1130]|uniref:DUF7263 family protein n=1 Tax=unclassified Haloarcula TaxID=2624677 RepID=UPI001247C9A3|nr:MULTISPECIES: hypothetical protein [unclassified Haloarcula]KAA9396743.1 hypothetical protein Har1129_00225 [Haloarcula sp. CBA1129]KAA9401704.1 hypothetical protein Har1130_02720 [Haloarcula sp. CBA1130]
MTERRWPFGHDARAQTSLPALGVALVLLTVVTGLGVAMADTAIAGADRSPDERRVAAAIADRLVAADGPLAARSNVLNQSRVDGFDQTALERSAPPASEYGVSVELADEEIARTGTVQGGTRISRLVVVESREPRTLTPDLTTADAVTLPRRSAQATVTIDPPAGTTVWTVRANDRVLLHNRSGLHGSHTVPLVPYETTELRFQHAGRLESRNVTISYDAPRSTKETLVVTVDA